MVNDYNCKENIFCKQKGSTLKEGNNDAWYFHSPTHSGILCNANQMKANKNVILFYTSTGTQQYLLISNALTSYTL